MTTVQDIYALYPGHDLTHNEAVSLAACIDANHEAPLMGPMRELFDALLAKAEQTQNNSARKH